ncbi:ABC-2 type transport system permease protein [Parafrankia irregularis]|uniref:Transport permease protein n=1 Tax=Parafrankia irregularis TaxID=795642 RepID=A0A0S4QRX8_9ACTN|nr:MULTISPECIES: ABC transporter permease [Parafrankia]MBE3206160.1 ABC transporter permease [Parafrankia sp. CH37]CUU57624.1 ABC-2 type transport system permease protein [Parafrankia irregularis]
MSTTTDAATTAARTSSVTGTPAAAPLAGRSPVRPLDTEAAFARTKGRVGAGDTVVQTFAMAWRALKKMRRNPEQFFDVALQPLLFTAMFAYVFGGAISGDVDSYLPLLIPGIVAQTVLTTCMATGTQLREDMDKGVFDRFRSLPMSRVAPLAGPMVADLVRYVTAAVLTYLMGLLLGYRPGGGVPGVAGAVVLAVFTGWAIAWAFTWIGTIARSARSVQGISMMILFPLTFLSNAFVPADTLPGWLETFTKVNPVSHLVSATRDLANNGTVTAQVAWTLLTGLAVIAIFLPLSVASYRRNL